MAKILNAHKLLQILCFLCGIVFYLIMRVYISKITIMRLKILYGVIIF